MREAQKQTLQAWLTNRYNIVLKARQIGYSTLASSIALWLVFFYPDKAIVMLSRGEREAVSLLKKGKYAYKHLPQWMVAKGPQLTSDPQMRMQFDNDSQIESLPSTQDPARGESAYMIIVDEWAFLENPEDAWASIEPVADVGGRVIGLSTANGSGNFFHNFWQRAQNGHGRFVPLFYPWSANSDRDESWYEDKAEDLAATPWILHQEYPRNPEEAFIRSGRTVFDIDLLDQMGTADPFVGALWAATETSRYAEFREDAKGQLSIFEFPVKGETYALGADVAEGLEHGDYSSAHVLDLATGSVVAHWHGHVDPDQFALVLARLGWFYNGALVGVEVNNHGLTTCFQLQKIPYQRLYYRTSIDQRTNKTSRRVGWRTQQNTKPYLIDGLVKALRGERALTEDGKFVWSGGMAVRDERTISELKLYVREPDGKTMHGSPHDDRVISLAIAWEMTKFVHNPAYQSTKDHGWGTGDWWEQQIVDAAADAKKWVIGASSVRTSR